MKEENKKEEKNSILNVIKRIKEEYNRVEQVKKKEESNLKKLDEKATLINLRKDEEQENKSNSQILINNSVNSNLNNQLSLSTNGPNGTILLPESMNLDNKNN